MFSEAAITTVGALVTELTGAGATLLGIVPDIGDTIVETPILLLGFVVWAVGACFGLFGRGMSRG